MSTDQLSYLRRLEASIEALALERLDALGARAEELPDDEATEMLANQHCVQRTKTGKCQITKLGRDRRERRCVTTRGEDVR